SEALNEKPFANYWMHNGYMNIDNEKISKSLNNFVLTKDLIEAHDPMVLRFFMLSVHYRNTINFTATLYKIENHTSELIKTSYKNLEHSKATCLHLDIDNSSWIEKITQHETNIEAAMDDNFNTTNAITVLFD